MKVARLIAAAALVVTLASGTAAEIRPLAVNNGSVGGGALNAYTPGVEGGTGLNNIGLLVRTWGKVQFVDTTNKYFYIDDGTSRIDGSSNIGIRISYGSLAQGNTIQVPNEGAYVLVTGISSTWEYNNKCYPNIRPRHDPDVQILKP